MVKEGQTIQWPKEKAMIYKTLHTKNKDLVTWTPLKPGMNSGVPEGVGRMTKSSSSMEIVDISIPE